MSLTYDVPSSARGSVLSNLLLVLGCCFFYEDRYEDRILTLFKRLLTRKRSGNQGSPKSLQF
jgi:hypothetical protein